uniref:Uncharacterized protein n=1 Tax=Coccolithus braarudii TaxID=221442 RepID=A0A7S0Q1J5_9EUKA
MGHPRHTSAEVDFEQSHGLWRLSADWPNRLRARGRGRHNGSFTEWVLRLDRPRSALVLPAMRAIWSEVKQGEVFVESGSPRSTPQPRKKHERRKRKKKAVV